MLWQSLFKTMNEIATACFAGFAMTASPIFSAVNYPCNKTHTKYDGVVLPLGHFDTLRHTSTGASASSAYHSVTAILKIFLHYLIVFFCVDM